MIANKVFGIQDLKTSIRQKATMLDRMRLQNLTIAEKIQTQIKTALDYKGLLPQLVEKGKKIAIYLAGVFIAECLITYVQSRIMINFLAANTVSRITFAFLPSQLPLFARLYQNGPLRFGAKIAGGILIGLAIEEALGFIFSAVQKSKLSETDKELGQAIDQQVAWLSKMVGEKITRQEFFERHKKLQKQGMQISIKILE